MPGDSFPAAKSYTGQFARVNRPQGTGSAISAVTQVALTASAAVQAADVDVGAVTMTVVATNDYTADIQFTVDLTGTTAATGQVNCLVEVVWFGYVTAPVLSQL